VSDESDFVVIGLLRRAHGVEGELAVQPVTDMPERFDRLERVLVRHGGSTREISVKKVRSQGGSMLLRLEGVDDRTSAEALKGAELGVRRKDVCPLPEDTYYVFDLIGCRVVGETGKEIGVIDDVWKMPANDVFAVISGSREILIPVVKSVVKKIDTDQKVVVIEEMEGLLD
jgi:16S rRNA processing protein RimM